MKEPLMLLIANMAASDLLTAIFFLPRLITIEVVGSYSFLLRGLAGTIIFNNNNNNNNNNHNGLLTKSTGWLFLR